MQAVVWRLLLQISKNIVTVRFLPFSFSIEILLVCDDELLFFVQNWRIDCWLGLMLHHRDGSCLQWQNVLKYCHRYAFMQGTRFCVMLRRFCWTER